MEGDHRFHAGGSRQASRLTCGQVALLRGAFAVGGEKRRFDEQQIRARGERHDARRVVPMISDVGDVGDFLAGHHFENALLEFAEREKFLVHSALRFPPHPKRRCLRLTGEHRVLEFPQPLPGRKTECVEPAFPDVDVLFFLEREAEAGRAVIEQSAAHPERSFVEQNAVVDCELVLVFAPERGPAAEAGAPRHATGVYLGRFEREIGGIALDQVPGVRAELACHLGEEPGRAVQPHHALAAETDPQQPVETDEVVHVRVRHKYVAHAQDLARRQRPQITEVEQQCAFFEQAIDVKAWVAKRAIDQRGMEQRFHAQSRC